MQWQGALVPLNYVQMKYDDVKVVITYIPSAQPRFTGRIFTVCKQML